MADRTGVKAAGQVGHIGNRLGRIPARLGAALHPPDAVHIGHATIGDIATIAGVGDDIVVQGLRIAADIADTQRVAEVVGKDGREGIDRVLQIVAVLQAIEGVARHIQNTAFVITHIGLGE